MASSDDYRSDIDGMRALAVLLVLLFHLGVSGLSGGFVGVDVFFVISGFVVTRTLGRQLQSGTFSFRRFYVARFWRLQPAFFLVGLATLAAALAVQSGPALVRTAESGLAALGLSANVYFWFRTDGYTTDASEREPFLQMWSLGVEEQFYLLWPLLLVGIYRFRRHLSPAAGVAALLSLLALSEYLARNYPSAAYYLLPARLFELGLGAALTRSEGLPLGRKAASVLSVVGVLAILASAVVLHEDSTFPGLLALIPCLGAALLIQAGRTRHVFTPLLEHPASLLFGKLSYGIYLWHWAPIALLRTLKVELTPLVQLGVAGGTFLVAYASFRFWETPTRKGTLPKLRWVAVTMGIFLAAALLHSSRGHASVGADAEGEAVDQLVEDGPSEGEPAEDERSTGGHSAAAPKRAKKTTKGARRSPYADLDCLFGAKDWAEVDRCGKVRHKDGNRRVLVWGDSHARVHASALGERDGFTVTALTIQGCPPLLGIHRQDREGAARNCNEKQGAKVLEFVQRHRFDAIVLSSRWQLYQEGWIRGGHLARLTHFISDAETKGTDAASSSLVFARALVRTAQRLHDVQFARVVLVLPTPIMPGSPDPKDTSLAVPRADYLERRKPFDLLVKRLPPQVMVVDISSALCDASSCRAFGPAGPLYSDNNHLNRAGRRLIGPLLERALSASMPAPRKAP